MRKLVMIILLFCFLAGSAYAADSPSIGTQAGEAAAKAQADAQEALQAANQKATEASQEISKTAEEAFESLQKNMDQAWTDFKDTARPILRGAQEEWQKFLAAYQKS